jgi:ribosomal protein S18 acetylase RimI-like enzyme
MSDDEYRNGFGESDAPAETPAEEPAKTEEEIAAETAKAEEDFISTPEDTIENPLVPEEKTDDEDEDRLKGAIGSGNLAVDYPEAIFSNCLLNNQGGYMTEAAFYFLEEENKEVILGLIICEWRWVDKFFFQFVGDNILEEINKSIDYEEEVQFFLSKQKFYTSVYIVSIGVIDECRKMNIGTNLIKSALNYAISFPFCVGIFLNVIVDNFSGKKFYEKNGLICSNRLKDFYVIEDKKYDSDVYVRIFNREKKNLARKYQYNFLNLKQKIFKLFIMEPFYFMVKLFLIFCLCRCFKRKIKYDK